MGISCVKKLDLLLTSAKWYTVRVISPCTFGAYFLFIYCHNICKSNTSLSSSRAFGWINEVVRNVICLLQGISQLYGLSLLLSIGLGYICLSPGSLCLVTCLVYFNFCFLLNFYCDLYANNRFAEVAKLVRVWWLEIRGKIDTSMLSPATCYAAYLVFKLQGAVEGFRSGDTVASVGIAGSGSNMSTIFLSPDVEPIRGPRRRRDSWLEIELGECFIEGGEDGEIEMSIMDVMPTVKAGLIVQGIEIRPKAG